MKNLLKLLGLGVVAAFLALGCSNDSDNAYALINLPSSSGAKTAQKTITLVATGDKDAIKFPAASAAGISASIVADTIDAATELKFHLFTERLAGTGTVPVKKDLAFTAGAAPNVGTIALSVPDGYYRFYLFATKGTSAATDLDGFKDDALFWGQTEVDLRTSADTVTFYLTSDGLTGSSKVSIGLKTTGWTVTAGWKVFAGITDKTTGKTFDDKTIDPTDLGASLFEINDPQTKITAADPSTKQFVEDTVAAGTYNFEVHFQKGAKDYIWSDTLIVAPRHDIDTIVAIPDVIELPPDAPKAFNATFKDPALADAADPLSGNVSQESYTVQFDWDATDSVNESYFEIELLKIKNDVEWTKISDNTSTDWDTGSYRTDLKATVQTLGKDFYGNELQGWVKGSLRRNNTSCQVQLPLGDRYLARIAAVNDAGRSSWCYVDFDNTVPTALASGFSRFAAASKVINRYRLTYNLDGGTITIPGSPSPTTSTKDIIEYRTQNTVANGTANNYKAAAITSDIDVPTADIWNPATDTATYISLIKDGKAWTAWRKNSSASSVYYRTSESDNNPPDYTGCENLVLYASYSPAQAGVTIFDPNDWTIGLVNFFSDASDPAPANWTPAVAGTGIDASNLATKQVVAMDLKTADGKITWNVAYTADQKLVPVVWNRATYTIKRGNGVLVGGPYPCGTIDANGFEVTTDFDGFSEGKYLITFCVYAPINNEPYTYPILVDIKNSSTTAP
ncbi:MAG: hypothetical protein II610_05315 [Treponema sp.]|nr:hypothetical protein [Treponema sp.]